MGNTLLARAALPGVHTYVKKDIVGSLFPRGVTWVNFAGKRCSFSADAVPVVHVEPEKERRSGRHQITFVYSHGNAEDLGSSVEWMQFLANRFKVDVFSYEYAGYGANYEHATERAVYRNCRSVLKFLSNEFPNRRFILFGRSVGTAPALYGATNCDKVAGAILQSAFRSIMSTKCNPKYVPRCMDMFLNESMMAVCDVPVLLIHGTNDKVVPFGNAKVLSAFKCVWGKCWLDGAGHNDIDLTPKYRTEMCAKIDHYLHDLDVDAIPLVGVKKRAVLRREDSV